MCVCWLFPFKSKCHPSFTQTERTNFPWVIIPKVLSFVKPDSPLCFSSYDLLHLFPVHLRAVSVLTNTVLELIAYLWVAISVACQCFQCRCRPSRITPNEQFSGEEHNRFAMELWCGCLYWVSVLQCQNLVPSNTTQVLSHDDTHKNWDIEGVFECTMYFL